MDYVDLFIDYTDVAFLAKPLLNTLFKWTISV